MTFDSIDGRIQLQHGGIQRDRKYKVDFSIAQFPDVWDSAISLSFDEQTHAHNKTYYFKIDISIM